MKKQHNAVIEFAAILPGAVKLEKKYIPTILFCTKKHRSSKKIHFYHYKAKSTFSSVTEAMIIAKYDFNYVMDAAEKLIDPVQKYQWLFDALKFKGYHVEINDDRRAIELIAYNDGYCQ